MSSQFLSKLLATLSLLATATAIYIWRTTGETPSPWLIRGAVALLAAALVVFVIDRTTRPRLMLQFLAALFATVALFAFTSDLTAAHSWSAFHSTSVLERLAALAPTLENAMKSWITRNAGAEMWDPVITTILSLPASLVFGMLALISGYAGRSRNEVQIFVN